MKLGTYTGMLWLDDSKQPLAEKIRRAVQHYEEKNGCKPGVVVVNPETEPLATIDGITIHLSQYVQPNNFLLAQGEQ